MSQKQYEKFMDLLKVGEDNQPHILGKFTKDNKTIKYIEKQNRERGGKK